MDDLERDLAHDLSRRLLDPNDPDGWYPDDPWTPAKELAALDRLARELDLHAFIQHFAEGFIEVPTDTP